MKIKFKILKNFMYFMLLLSLSSWSFAQKKEITITIDDLPFVGEYRNFHLNMIMTTLKNQQIPATGFIIAREVRQDNWELLNQFREAGFGLGNHTFSHANLNLLKSKEYIQEIKKADQILAPVLTQPKYFRYPYLAMSTGTKRNKVLCYLAKKKYQVAPITIDSKDFVFNQRLLSVPEIDRRGYLNEMKPFYLDFIWQQTLKAEEYTQYHHNPDQAQILLIHANLLNAYVLPDIIKLYQDQGYTFVNLEEALKTYKNVTYCPKNSTTSKSETQIALHKKSKTDLKIESFVDWD